MSLMLTRSKNFNPNVFEDFSPKDTSVKKNPAVSLKVLFIHFKGIVFFYLYCHEYSLVCFTKVFKNVSIKKLNVFLLLKRNVFYAFLKLMNKKSLIQCTGMRLNEKNRLDSS